MNKQLISHACILPPGERPPILASGVRWRRTRYIAIGLTLIGLGLSGCTVTGMEPVPLDQNPGDNGAPTATN